MLFLNDDPGGRCLPCVNPTFLRNFLLGHVHLTDFNIATILKDHCLATSLSGTKAYMGKESYFLKCQYYFVP